MWYKHHNPPETYEDIEELSPCLCSAKTFSFQDVLEIDFFHRFCFRALHSVWGVSSLLQQQDPDCAHTDLQHSIAVARVWPSVLCQFCQAPALKPVQLALSDLSSASLKLALAAAAVFLLTRCLWLFWFVLLIAVWCCCGFVTAQQWHRRRNSTLVRWQWLWHVQIPRVM